MAEFFNPSTYNSLPMLGDAGEQFDAKRSLVISVRSSSSTRQSGLSASS
jgi:hypothetical protein